MSHHCHALYCQKPCRPEYLMCRRHWAMVPGALQAAVYRTYRAGQCDDKAPSRAWFDAAHAAIRAVADAEKRSYVLSKSGTPMELRLKAPAEQPTLFGEA